MHAGPVWEAEGAWMPWIHGVWADLTLLSCTLMRIQQIMTVAPTPAAAPAGSAGTDWLQAYA